MTAACAVKRGGHKRGGPSSRTSSGSCSNLSGRATSSADRKQPPWSSQAQWRLSEVARRHAIEDLGNAA